MDVAAARKSTFIAFCSMIGLSLLLLASAFLFLILYQDQKPSPLGHIIPAIMFPAIVCLIASTAVGHIHRRLILLEDRVTAMAEAKPSPAAAAAAPDPVRP